MDFFFQFVGLFFVVFVVGEFIKSVYLYKENRKPFAIWVFKKLRDFFAVMGLVLFIYITYVALTGQM